MSKMERKNAMKSSRDLDLASVAGTLPTTRLGQAQGLKVGDISTISRAARLSNGRSCFTYRLPFQENEINYYL